MLEALFQLFFQYRPVVFSEGELRLAAWSGSYAAAAVAAVAITAAVASYRAGADRLRPRDRAVLTALRVALLGLLLLILFRPVLVVRAAVPQQNVVGVLVDDSASMQIGDENGAPRAEFVRAAFGRDTEGLLGAIADRFSVRVFRFSSSLARLGAEESPTFAGTQTRLGAALDAARQELAGLPVSGLVLVTDGADTAADGLDEPLLALTSAGLPVFTVGVGQERLEPDLQIGRVAAPRTALKGTTLLVDVIVSQRGYSGETVTLDVEDEGRIVGSQPVTFPGDGSPASARVAFTVSDAGPRSIRFRIAPQPGELVAANNEREVLVDVRDRREKILYFEGEPRFELKFIRRAVAEDPNLQVVVLQRTADTKYLRLDVDSPDELVTGFPTTREELFGYRGIVLGSIEAGAFTGDQLRMLADFVDRRGGGLLMLGGPRAFGEGGYAGTPVDDILPVVLPAGAKAAGPGFSRLTVRPTRAGEGHAVTQLGEEGDGWDSLPAVTSVNDVTAIKPGATVLLSGAAEDRGDRPVLVFHRYGRGKVFAFTPQDSWLWQMHASVSVEDMRHENYWRQLLRWLVDDVPDVVESRTTERVDPGGRVRVTAEVVDGSFVELNDATVTATVTRPDGGVQDVPLAWTGDRSGEFAGAFDTTEPGWYEARIEARRAGETIGTSRVHVRAAPGDVEAFDAGRQTPTLRRIAEETGGRYYDASSASGLPQDLTYTGRGVTTVEELDLWHLPVVLLLLVVLLSAEWGYRRAVGLA